MMNLAKQLNGPAEWPPSPRPAATLSDHGIDEDNTSDSGIEI